MDVADVIRAVHADVYSSSGEGLQPGVEYPGVFSVPVSRIVVDSRDVEPGSIFVALPGEAADGHSFVANALEAGASGAIVERIDATVALPPGNQLYLVKNSLTALQDLARYWRDKHDVLVIGVTGSIGKTTVKEAVAWTLDAPGSERVLKSEANFNTEIGMPLALLRLRDTHRIAVLEMGMYERGDISLLANIAKPDVGIVTNVLPVHLERTGSIEATAHGKAELVHSLPETGLAVLNGDDDLVRAMVHATAAKASLYGAHKAQYDFQLTAVAGRGSKGFEADYKHGSRRMHAVCPTPGAHNAVNLLPAIAVAHHLGVDWDAIKSRLDSFHLEGRAGFLPGPNGSRLLDDRYNASADSVLAALRLLNEEPGRHFALLGDMYELGEEEESQHRIVGRATNDLDGLVLLGPRTRWIHEEAIERGLSSSRIIQVRDNEQAIETARRLLGPGDVMLIKGSRGMQLEMVVEALSGDDVHDSEHTEDSGS